MFINNYKNVQRYVSEAEYINIKENVVNDYYYSNLKTIEISRKYDIAYPEVIDIIGHDYATNQSDDIVREVALCVCNI